MPIQIFIFVCVVIITDEIKNPIHFYDKIAPDIIDRPGQFLSYQNNPETYIVKKSDINGRSPSLRRSFTCDLTGVHIIQSDKATITQDWKHNAPDWTHTHTHTHHTHTTTHTHTHHTHTTDAYWLIRMPARDQIRLHFDYIVLSDFISHAANYVFF